MGSLDTARTCADARRQQRRRGVTGLGASLHKGCVVHGARVHMLQHVEAMRNWRFANRSVVVRDLVLGLCRVVGPRAAAVREQDVCACPACELLQIRAHSVSESKVAALVLEVHPWRQVMFAFVVAHHVEDLVNEQGCVAGYLFREHVTYGVKWAPKHIRGVCGFYHASTRQAWAQHDIAIFVWALRQTQHHIVGLIQHCTRTPCCPRQSSSTSSGSTADPPCAPAYLGHSSPRACARERRS
jgi:hypothetical protein